MGGARASGERAQPRKKKKKKPHALSPSQHQVDACLFGSVPLRTYLPDGDIDVALVQRGGGGAGPTTPALGPLWADRLEAALLAAGRDPASPFPVRHVSLIQAEVRLLKCVVGDAVVDVSFSTLGGLRAVAFLEATARAVGKGNLFKRGVLAVKAWAGYEGRLLGAHAGLLSTYAVEALVLRLLVGGARVPVPGVALPAAPTGGATPASLLPPPPPTQACPYPLDTPLAILRAFLATYACFDWAHHALTVAGPVPVAVLASPATAAALAAAPTPAAAFDLLARLAEAADPADPPPGPHGPPLPPPPPILGVGRLRSLIAAYSAPTAAGGEGGGGSLAAAATATAQVAAGAPPPAAPPPAFAAKHLNIADPLAPTNNLGRPLAKGSAARVVKALGLGSALLEAAVARAAAAPPAPAHAALTGRRGGPAAAAAAAATAAARAATLGAAIANLDGFFRNAWGARAAHYAARVLPAMRAASETAAAAAAVAASTTAGVAGPNGGPPARGVAALANGRARPGRRAGGAGADRRANGGGPARGQQLWSPAVAGSATPSPAPPLQPRAVALAAGAGGGGIGPSLDGDLPGLVLQLRVAEAAAAGKPPPPPLPPVARDGRHGGANGGGGQAARPRQPRAARSPSAQRAGSGGSLPPAQAPPPAGPATPSPQAGAKAVAVGAAGGEGAKVPAAAAASHPPPPPSPRPVLVQTVPKPPPPGPVAAPAGAAAAPPPPVADAPSPLWPALPAHRPRAGGGVAAAPTAAAAAPPSAAGPTLAQVLAAPRPAAPVRAVDSAPAVTAAAAGAAAASAQAPPPPPWWAAMSRAPRPRAGAAVEAGPRAALA